MQSWETNVSTSIEVRCSGQKRVWSKRKKRQSTTPASGWAVVPGARTMRKLVSERRRNMSITS
eukprot:2237075-Prymnesium_polylepis.2